MGAWRTVAHHGLGLVGFGQDFVGPPNVHAYVRVLSERRDTRLVEDVSDGVPEPRLEMRVNIVQQRLHESRGTQDKTVVEKHGFRCCCCFVVVVTENTVMTSEGWHHLALPCGFSRKPPMSVVMGHGMMNSHRSSSGGKSGSCSGLLRAFRGRQQWRHALPPLCHRPQIDVFIFCQKKSVCFTKPACSGSDRKPRAKNEVQHLTEKEQA